MFLKDERIKFRGELKEAHDEMISLTKKNDELEQMQRDE